MANHNASELGKRAGYGLVVTNVPKPGDTEVGATVWQIYRTRDEAMRALRDEQREDERLRSRGARGLSRDEGYAVVKLSRPMRRGQPIMVPVTGRSFSRDAHGNLKVKEPLEAYEHANPMSAGAEMALVGVGVALLAGLGYLLYSKSSATASTLPGGI